MNNHNILQQILNMYTKKYPKLVFTSQQDDFTLKFQIQIDNLVAERATLFEIGMFEKDFEQLFTKMLEENISKVI